MAESKEEQMSPLMKVKEESEKSWLKTQYSENYNHDIWCHHFMANSGETVETVTDFIFWAPKSLQMVIAAMKLKDTCSLEKLYDQPRQHIKKQGHYFVNKGLSSQSYGFSSSHVWL